MKTLHSIFPSLSFLKDFQYSFLCVEVYSSFSCHAISLSILIFPQTHPLSQSFLKAITCLEKWGVGNYTSVYIYIWICCSPRGSFPRHFFSFRATNFSLRLIVFARDVSLSINWLYLVQISFQPLSLGKCHPASLTSNYSLAAETPELIFDYCSKWNLQFILISKKVYLETCGRWRGNQTAARNKRKLMIFGLRLDRSKMKKLEQHLPLLKNAPKPMNKYSAQTW